ncbi:cupin domain-containing protein [Campylobacter sp. MG1]|uniref:cupin domain-containing protein n=1 Tax=Campylobacter sp. MG1 TaxID=2976332 RepID=UPI00226D23E4|nr:cupin domain-containing protein [Campylobacter sp. MG1]
MNYEVFNWDNKIIDFNVNVICDDEFSKEIQILMPKGSSMDKHNAPARIIVQVLKGEIDFEINGEVKNLKSLMSIRVDAKIFHSLYAKEDSIIRLSLAKNDSVSRVKSVIFK